MASREDCVFLARLSEQAERYPGTLSSTLYNYIPEFILFFFRYAGIRQTMRLALGLSLDC